MSPSRRSFLAHLECSACGDRLDADVPQNLCRCGAPLLARYDLEALGRAVGPADLAAREPSLWRYRELLPVRADEHEITLGEGMTPVLALPRLGADLGLPRLHMKDESLLPSATFKARGAAVGISRARELGIDRVVMPSNGNAAAAWAAYAARAGIDLFAVMPAGVPAVTISECAMAGASVALIDGLIDDAGALVGRIVQDPAWFDASTLKEPYRIEGKKTMGIELAEQLGWRVPDAIIYPAGGGVGLIGIHKALLELRELGWISERLPKLIVVQAEGCAPLVSAWEQGLDRSEPWRNGTTVAFGINVPKALGDFLVLRAVRETGGCAIAVSDDQLLSELRTLARVEGSIICPEGAATLAAARILRTRGDLDGGDLVVAINTGSGLKYSDVLERDRPAVQDPNSLRDVDGSAALAARLFGATAAPSY